MPNLRLRFAPAEPAAPALAAEESVRIRDVRKTFGDATVLRGADLELAPGRLLALLGPSGCGKTTLLRCVAGLECPDSGSISVGGRELFSSTVNIPAEKRRIGMVFQDWALFPHLTVAANVGYGLRRGANHAASVAAALELVDLLEYGSRAPMTLSGGQQQRVALARALATRPSVLLLDEPFSNLDASLRGTIRNDVRKLLVDLSITALFVTHDQEEAFVVGDEVAVMLDGRVVQQSLPADLYTCPATRAVADFIGDANLLGGTAHGRVATTSIGSVPLRESAHGSVDVMIRPEQMSVHTGRGATIEQLDYYGHDAVYHVLADDGSRVRVRVIDTPKYRPGDVVEVRFDGEPTAAFAPADT